MVEELKIGGRKGKRRIPLEIMEELTKIVKEILTAEGFRVKATRAIIEGYYKLGIRVKELHDQGYSYHQISRELREKCESIEGIEAFGDWTLRKAAQLAELVRIRYSGSFQRFMTDLEERYPTLKPIWRNVAKAIPRMHKNVQVLPKKPRREEISAKEARKKRDTVTHGEGVFLENKPDSRRSVTPVTSETSTYTDILTIANSEDPRLLIYGEIVARYRGLIQNLRTFLLDSIQRYVSKQNLPLIMDELDWKLKEALDKVNEYAKEIIDLYIKPSQMS